jgi:Domain of unknown function (DUF5063)
MAGSIDLTSFVSVAQAFLKRVDGHKDRTVEALISDIELDLLNLYREILLVPLEFPEEDRPDDPVSTEEIEHIRDQLRTLLGEADLYRVVFDPYEGEVAPPVINSISQDLAEIYGDLSRGLRRWQVRDHMQAAYEWRFGFQYHWGRHLVHLLGALYALHFDHSWDVPALGEREA